MSKSKNVVLAIMNNDSDSIEVFNTGSITKAIKQLAKDSGNRPSVIEDAWRFQTLRLMEVV